MLDRIKDQKIYIYAFVRSPILQVSLGTNSLCSFGDGGSVYGRGKRRGILHGRELTVHLQIMIP